MRLSEKIPRPVGVFRLEVFERGVLIERVEERNLWVAAGSQNTASLYSGAAGPITKIGWGTNNAAPQLTDTALTGAYLNNVTPTLLGTGGLKLAFTLGTGEANGLAICEFGLLTAAGVLCARKNRATPIYKSAAVTLAGSWTLQF